ncbi:Proline-rich nuclear receptor coactivator motif [Microdochium nivale]|nr:Proline-rich nuclear receptor coactivator motif [Microdochium nivale]
MNQSPRPKNTPGRRRQGRNTNNNNNNNNASTPQKSYVSENDIPAYLSGGGEQHFASPSSPLKPATGQKPRAKNRPRNNKNGPGSPSHHNKQQLSHQPIPIEAPAAIFAGATFHASPAPSSLPMPSFLSRSNADSPPGKSSPLAHATSSPQQEPSPPSTDSEDGQGFKQPSVDRSNDSPLEVFFRAQRAEKAKEHRAKSANAATPTFAPGPFPPPHESPMEIRTVPRTQPQNQSHSYSNVPKSAGPGISAIELDGNPGRALGPAFSTPYSERIRAARPAPTTASGSNPVASSPQFDESQALLRMLHHGKPALGQQPAFEGQSYQQQQHYFSSPPSASASQLAYTHYRQPAAHHQYSPQRAQASYQQPPHGHNLPAIPHGKAQLQHAHGPTSDSDQISKMEASLRQVLKLDSSS